jgi:hypothetical protein
MNEMPSHDDFLQIRIEHLRGASFFVAAYDGDERVGFVLVHELSRRGRGDSTFLVYDVAVDERYRPRMPCTATSADAASTS